MREQIEVRGNAERIEGGELPPNELDMVSGGVVNLPPITIHGNVCGPQLTAMELFEAMLGW